MNVFVSPCSRMYKRLAAAAADYLFPKRNARIPIQPAAFRAAFRLLCNGLERLVRQYAFMRTLDEIHWKLAVITRLMARHGICYIRLLTQDIPNEFLVI